MTPAEFSAYQRDMVTRSLALPSSRADRRDRPLKPRVVVVVLPGPVMPHVFVVPTVMERTL